jgi:predicted ATPase
VLARRGLELLETLPETPERARRELALLIALGPPLIATVGWTVPEVQSAYTRAQALCARVGETPDLFPVLWGLWFFYATSLQIRTARELGEQLLNIAQCAQDPALLLQAHHALGPLHVQMGDWDTALAHLEQGIALYDPQQHRAHAFLYGGHDPGVCCRVHSAWCLWVLGYPDQALRRSHEALACARDLSHPTSLAHAQLSISWFHQFRRDHSVTQELAEALIRLAAEQGLPTYLAGGSVLRGWTLSERGQADEGIAQIRQGLAALALYWRINFLPLLAEAYGRAGKAADGLAVLTEALTAVQQTEFCCFEPEMHRLKGELLLSCAPENPADAEACFRKAITLARCQSARSWELRAVLSLSRLYRLQGKEEEARPILAEIYGWFTEGFDTADLQEAQALLQVLS